MTEDGSLEELIELFMMEEEPSASGDEEKILTKEISSKFEKKIDSNNQEIEKLKKDFKNLIKQLKNKDSHSLKKPKGHTLKKELAKHAKEFDFLRCLIMTGDTYCEIKGVVFKLYADFITLLVEGNRLLKIPLDKIVALEEKKISENKKENLSHDTNKEESTSEQVKKSDKIKSIKKLSGIN